jgi:hypothetical protein
MGSHVRRRWDLQLHERESHIARSHGCQTVDSIHCYWASQVVGSDAYCYSPELELKCGISAALAAHRVLPSS